MIENFKLKVFRVVADCPGFRRAAEELHLTQPSITSQIKTLQEGLGIALFDRTGRDINRTPARTTLLPYVRRIEAISNEAAAALASFGGEEVEAEIGIGFVPYLALEKALKRGAIKAIRLENGPIERELSIVLLNGPEPKGPLGQLLQHLRTRAILRRPGSTIGGATRGSTEGKARRAAPISKGRD